MTAGRAKSKARRAERLGDLGGGGWYAPVEYFKILLFERFKFLQCQAIILVQTITFLFSHKMTCLLNARCTL